MAKWLEVSEVSRRLTVSSSTVYRMINLGFLKSGKMGTSRCIRVSEKSVIDFEKRRDSVFDE